MPEAFIGPFVHNIVSLVIAAFVIIVFVLVFVVKKTKLPNLTVDDTLTVNGVTGITGPTGIGGALSVAEITSLSRDLIVTGTTTLGGDLVVTGNTTLGGALDVSEDVVLNKGLGVGKNISDIFRTDFNAPSDANGDDGEAGDTIIVVKGGVYAGSGDHYNRENSENVPENVYFSANANGTGYTESKIVLRKDDGNFDGVELLGGLAGSGTSPNFLEGTEFFAINEVKNGTYIRTLSCDRSGSDGVNLVKIEHDLYVGGSIEYVGNLSQASDRRLKSNIEELDTKASLETINKLKIKSYEKKRVSNEKKKGKWMSKLEGEKEKEIGVIAQELLEIDYIKEAVKGREEDEEGNEEILSVNYTMLFSVALSAIQELSKRVEELESKIN